MTLKVTVVGVGLVGEAIVSCLKERNFPCEWPPRVAATRERPQTLAGEKMLVEETTADVFDGADVVLFAGKEGAKGASATWRETAEKAGAICVDNGRDFRLAPDVPLIVPEVNADAIANDTRFIASPNCSTIQLVVALAPLHRATRIKRIVVSTYQSTSGWGLKGPQELKAQTPAALESLDDIPFDPTVFARPVAFNCIPHIEPFMDADYTREEWKMVHETRKILGDSTIRISTTAVRVPVFVGHGEAIWIETDAPLSPNEARDLLRDTPGVILMDEPAGETPRGDKNERTYPTPLDVLKHRDDVLVGRIRQDISSDSGLVLWCVSDNLRKGAALNVVQIAEELIRRGMLKP
ncbi:MAG: aspartate-semialdehyde dehydrogenase [Planctomycetota bacterium]|nr:aspartate-semialdehyde dehydrogenase [Planctomycetota bacterium]